MYYYDAQFRLRLEYRFTGTIDASLITSSTSIDQLVAVTPSAPSTADAINAGYGSAPIGSQEPPIGCMYRMCNYDNANSLVVLETTPDSRTEHVYDSGSPDRLQRGNLLLTKQVSSINSNDVIMRAYAYEPLYNRVRAQYDPRAFGNYPPPNGGAYTPERYAVVHWHVTRWLFKLAETRESDTRAAQQLQGKGG